MNCEEFLASIRQQRVPLGYGLVVTDFERQDGPVFEVTKPRFMYPLPLDDDEEPLKLLLVPVAVVQQVVLDLQAIPIGNMPFWFRFPVWK